MKEQIKTTERKSTKNPEVFKYSNGLMLIDSLPKKVSLTFHLKQFTHVVARIQRSRKNRNISLYFL